MASFGNFLSASPMIEADFKPTCSVVVGALSSLTTMLTGLSTMFAFAGRAESFRSAAGLFPTIACHMSFNSGQIILCNPLVQLLWTYLKGNQTKRCFCLLSGRFCPSCINMRFTGKFRVLASRLHFESTEHYMGGPLMDGRSWALFQVRVCWNWTNREC